jgi:hypothetical protein
LGASTATDWTWLVSSFERKIGLWYYKWLSLGGRLILVNSVLQSLAVYWMLLEKIPAKILTLLRKLSFNFLWNDFAGNRHFHLCKWQILSRPKREGGWGLKNLFTFNKALLACSFWRAITSNSFWHRVIMAKYFGSKPLSLWIRQTHFSLSWVSPIWRGLVSSSQVILHWLRWCPGSGTEVKLGRDKLIGLDDLSLLSLQLRSKLLSLNISLSCTN